jgi:alpha-1,2-mannosyltransferase
MVIACITVLAAGILVAQQLVGGHLSGVNEYDDGVYYLASLQVLHANLPYRDFAFIQPPGILLLLSPFAFLGQHLSSAAGLVAARLFIVAVGVVNVALVGLLLRRRSTLALVAGMGVAALYPEAVRATQTVLLEPVLVFFCLLALLMVFDGESLTPLGARWVWSGVLFGVAASMKIWAVVPLLALLLVARRLPGGVRWRLVAGAVLGGAAIGLPFFVFAPGAFLHDIVITQFIRGPGGSALPVRLGDLSGIPGLGSVIGDHHAAGGVLAAGVAVAAVLLVGAIYLRTKTKAVSALEELGLVASVLVVATLLLSPTYYYHYGEFAAPFLALAVSGMVERGRAVSREALVLAVAVLAAAGGLLGADLRAVAQQGPPRQITDAVADAIGTSGCVFTDNPSVLLLDNVVTADRPGCPTVVDWAAAERVVANGMSQSPADVKVDGVQDQTLTWLEDSQTVVIDIVHPDWGTTVNSYLRTNFDKVYAVPGWVSVYRRDQVDALKR